MDFEFLLVSRFLVDGGYLIPHAEKRAHHMAHGLNKLLLGPHMLWCFFNWQRLLIIDQFVSF